MQVDMFATNQASKRACSYDVRLYDWQSKINEASLYVSQASLLQGVMTCPKIEMYKSGTSSKSDLLGYMESGANVGICAVDASKPVLSLVSQYTSQGGKVFIDSGAFRNFKARLKDKSVPPLDFNRVMSRYRTVIEQCERTDGLIIVAPDIVGDQQGSFDLLLKFKTEITELSEQGATIMVPLQKGHQSLEGYYKRCVDLLSFEFICGIPSNAEAVSREEILSFLKVGPKSVHFLGTAESTLIHEAQYTSPSTQFSCDSTLIRKHVGQQRLLTEMQNQITDDVVGSALKGGNHTRISGIKHWDETEVLGDLVGFVDSLSPPALKRFAKALTATVNEITSCEDNDALWSYLDRVNYGFADKHVVDFLYTFCRQSCSPVVRRSVVSELSSLNLL